MNVQQMYHIKYLDDFLVLINWVNLQDLRIMYLIFTISVTRYYTCPLDNKFFGVKGRCKFNLSPPGMMLLYEEPIKRNKSYM